ASLKGEERRFADIAVERAKPSYARPPVRLPYGVGQSFAAGGPSFFDVLFGGPRPPAPVQPHQRRTFARCSPSARRPSGRLDLQAHSQRTLLRGRSNTASASPLPERHPPPQDGGKPLARRFFATVCL